MRMEFPCNMVALFNEYCHIGFAPTNQTTKGKTMTLTPGTKVDILINGEWEGPFTVTADSGRSPEHVVLSGPSNKFEHYADLGFNIREYVEPYPEGTNIREITSFDRGTKVTFECKDCAEKGIHIAYRSKDPFCSQWFPANELTQRAEFGIEPMPCPHTLKNGTWVTVGTYKP